jgi:predicted amidophosphoribosyltransferase
MCHQIKNVWYSHQTLPDLILPIPLHPIRLKERGFNQAIEIARPISKKLSIPIDTKGPKRIKYTLPQSGLPARQRRKNTCDAFVIQGDYAGLHIAVLDDVITTQHTMWAFCEVLTQAGAVKIDAWCCARAIVDIAQRRKTRYHR